MRPAPCLNETTSHACAVKTTKEESFRREGRRALGIAALGAIAFVVGFQGFWLERSLEDALSYRGYFEPSNGHVRLVFSEEHPTSGLSFPSPGLLEDGRYVVPMGTVVA